MTILRPEIPFLQDAPANSVKGTEVAVPVDRVSNLCTGRFTRSVAEPQCICELLIKNQQLRCALVETKEREPRETEGRNVRHQRQPLDESLTSSEGSWSLKRAAELQR
jgi:hypothetical protein